MRFPAAPFLLSVLVLSLALVGCGGGSGGGGGDGGQTGNEPNRPETGTVYLWIGADKDAGVVCGNPTTCPEGNNNYGARGILSVTASILDIQRFYVHFSLPELPPGTILQESWFELYHPGTREDGFTDDVLIPVALASGPWSPQTITYNNQPNRTTGGFTNINLNSAEWSSTLVSINQIVGDWFADPDTNYGLCVNWSTLMRPAINKGFYSINDLRRRTDDMGLSPRLLLKITLPEGTTTDDIILPPFLIPDHDLPVQPGQPIVTLEVSTGDGDNWPAAWRVRRGT